MSLHEIGVEQQKQDKLRRENAVAKPCAAFAGYDEEQRRTAEHIAPAADEPRGRVAHTEVAGRIERERVVEPSPPREEKHGGGQKIERELRPVYPAGDARIGERHAPLLGDGLADPLRRLPPWGLAFVVGKGEEAAAHKLVDTEIEEEAEQRRE